MDEKPTDNDGNPICARPCQDGLPCYKQVPVLGVACHTHDSDQPILPLPDDVPTYTCHPENSTRAEKTD